MADTYAARLVHTPAVTRRTLRFDDVALERRSLTARANLALVAMWAGLAVAIVVYAIDKESVGAAILAVFVVWQLLVPWRAAFRSDDEERAPRQIAFS